MNRVGTMESRAVVPSTQSMLAAPQPFLPSAPEFSVEQLMLYRHLVDRYITDLSTTERPVQTAAAEGAADGAPSETSAEGTAEGASHVAAEPAQAAASPISDALRFAQFTLASIEEALIATAVRAEAAKVAAAAPPVAPHVAVPTVAVAASGSIAPAPSVNRAAASSIAPAPGVSYTAGRVGPARSYTHAGPAGRTQRNAGMAPRHTARGPLPMVVVKMDGERPTVQNQAEVTQARAAAMAEAAAGHSQAMPGMAQAMQPGAAPRGPLPMVVVKMDGERPTVQNQAEVAQARAAVAAQRTVVIEQPVQPGDLPVPSDLSTTDEPPQE